MDRTKCQHDPKTRRYTPPRQPRTCTKPPTRMIPLPFETSLRPKRALPGLAKSFPLQNFVSTLHGTAVSPKTVDGSALGGQNRLRFSGPGDRCRRFVSRDSLDTVYSWRPNLLKRRPRGCPYRRCHKLLNRVLLKGILTPRDSDLGRNLNANIE